MQLYSSLRSNTTALSSVKPHAGWLFWDAPDLLFYSFTPCALSCENETLTSFISQLHAAVGGNLRARFGPVSPNLVCGHTQTTQSHPGKSDRQTPPVFFCRWFEATVRQRTATSIPRVQHDERVRGEREVVKRWRGQWITAERRL